MEKPVLKNDIDVKIEGVQKITDNMAEIKEYALETKKYYENLVFNDEQVKEAKDERAGKGRHLRLPSGRGRGEPVYPRRGVRGQRQRDR